MRINMPFGCDVTTRAIARGMDGGHGQAVSFASGKVPLAVVARLNDQVRKASANPELTRMIVRNVGSSNLAGVSTSIVTSDTTTVSPRWFIVVQVYGYARRMRKSLHVPPEELLAE